MAFEMDPWRPELGAAKTSKCRGPYFRVASPNSEPAQWTQPTSLPPTVHPHSPSLSRFNKGMTAETRNHVFALVIQQSPPSRTHGAIVVPPSNPSSDFPLRRIQTLAYPHFHTRQLRTNLVFSPLPTATDGRARGAYDHISWRHSTPRTTRIRPDYYTSNAIIERRTFVDTSEVRLFSRLGPRASSHPLAKPDATPQDGRRNKRPDGRVPPHCYRCQASPDPKTWLPEAARRHPEGRRQWKTATIRVRAPGGRDWTGDLGDDGEAGEVGAM